MSYSELTVKIIYGRSYNECNHPDCHQLIIEVDPNTQKTINHGEMAHIRAQRKGGERWVEDYPKDLLNSPDNLILLCANHHKVIDQKGAGKHYTMELLEKWKAEHYLAKELSEDREWIYCLSTMVFAMEGTQYQLEFWRDQSGNPRFYTPEQLVQARAAKEISIFFAELSSLLRHIESADGKPADHSHITLNDNYVRMFKEDTERLKRNLLNNDKYESGLIRLYSQLQACPDITLRELSLVGTTAKPQNTTTILIGEATPERLLDAFRSSD